MSAGAKAQGRRRRGLHWSGKSVQSIDLERLRRSGRGRGVAFACPMLAPGPLFRSPLRRCESPKSGSGCRMWRRGDDIFLVAKRKRVPRAHKHDGQHAPQNPSAVCLQLVAMTVGGKSIHSDGKSKMLGLHWGNRSRASGGSCMEVLAVITQSSVGRRRLARSWHADAGVGGGRPTTGEFSKRFLSACCASWSASPGGPTRRGSCGICDFSANGWMCLREGARYNTLLARAVYCLSRLGCDHTRELARHTGLATSMRGGSRGCPLGGGGRTLWWRLAVC